MKVKDIGEIEIKRPSNASLSKSGVLISIIYRVVFWGVLVSLFGGVVWEANTESGKPYTPALAASAVIVGDLVLMFIIKQYKKQTKDM